MDESGTEAEGIECRFVIEVYFQPLTAGPLGLECSKPDEFCANAGALVVGANLRIQEEG